jgi:TonB-linked SusC/RagA family outer membrane protein
MKRKLLLLLVAVLTTCVAAMAQGTKITGKVVDANGEPLLGAGVVVKGTTTGAATDLEGQFELTVPRGAVLEVSSIGYKTVEVPVGNQTRFEIVLEDDSEMLESTVVIGYGSVKRTNFTGSVQTHNVGESAVSAVPHTSPLEMLRGLATGVQMSQSGFAGASPSVQVRGQKSISGGSAPLIVLDGVIYQGRLTDIDPSTIESMSVMKDATSLASYGSQAANGVIMITSKKGKVGKPMINFRGTLSLVQQNYTPKLRTGEEYITMMNDRRQLPQKDATGQRNISWMSELERENYLAGRETDWYQYVQQLGVQQDYSLNVSGASDRMNYLFGVSYGDNTNFIKGNEFIRETVTARLTTHITDNISAGLNFNWSATQDDGVRPSYSRAFSPYGQPTMPDGSYRKYIIGPTQETATNPLWDVYNGRDVESRGNASTLGGNIEIKFPWIKGLSYKITGNYSIRNNQNRSFTHEKNLIQPTDTEYTTEVFDKYLSQASGSITTSKSISWVLDNILTYTRDLGEHYINATLVYTRDASKAEAQAFSGSDFSGIGNTTLGFYGLTNAGTHKITSISYTLHTDVGYLARVNYSFKNKYHFNASVRRDGSSVFGSGHKWGTFPAFGVAYTISDEPWFKVPVVNYLKLKLSWGKNGNQSLAPYQTLSNIAMGMSGGYVGYFGGKPIFGEALTRLGNPELGWETTMSWNGGFEADLFQRRLHWELDAYKSKTTDQIVPREIPVMTAGLTQQQSTLGRVDNWGIESSLRYNIIQKRDFHWDVNVNFTMNRNKLVEIEGGDEQDDPVNNRFFGKPLNPIYGYHNIGIVQKTDTEYMQINSVTPGDMKNENLDDDPKITPADRKILGYGQEAFRASLNTNLTWKNWSLYMMFNGVFSGGMYGRAINNAALLAYSEGMMSLNSINHPYWTEENPSDFYPKVFNVAGNPTYIAKYGFVRLQDVNLSYTLRGDWMKRIGLSSASIYVAGGNLFFIAPGWKYSDPEVRNPYSQQLRRTYTFGINVRF